MHGSRSRQYLKNSIINDDGNDDDDDNNDDEDKDGHNLVNFEAMRSRFCVVEDQTSTLWVVSLMMMMIINLMRMMIMNHTLLFLKNPIYAKTTWIMLTPLVLMHLLVLKYRTLRH